MINYSYEVLTLIVLFVISTSIMKRWRVSFTSSRFFSLCIFVNILASLSNMAAYCTLSYIHELPLWVNYISNSLYFLLIYTVVACYTLYISHHIASYSSYTRFRKPFIITYLCVYACFALIVLSNPLTGLLFHFDDGLNYTRGPLWISSYIYLTLSVLSVVVLSVISRGTRSNPYIRLVTFIIPTIYAAIIIKLMLPEANIETFIGAVTGLFIFIHLQSSRPELDPTTKLRNLDSFIEYIKFLEKENEPFQIILLSLRDFGSVNSSIGYIGGSKILADMADWLTSFYPDCPIFRYSPVSFTVILPVEPGENTDANVHRVIDSFPQTWNYNGQSYLIPAYYIDYVCRHISGNPYQVVLSLDYARKQMRTISYNHIHFNDELAAKLADRTELIKYLKKAIELKRFDIYLQPIYSAEDGCFTTAEALLRLCDDEGHFINPELFATAAEEAKLDSAMNRQLIDMVCSFLGSYPDLPIKTISINLTIQLLQDVTFADNLTEFMAKYGVSSDRIALEVTERILLSEDATVQLSLFKLRLSGFKLLLDDFGTGYSNFSALLRCNFDKIKLDKSLISANDKKSLDIVSTLINLFHDNGQTVVVEGVETEVQRDAILAAGADFIQGYYYSKPLPLDAYVDFITEKNSVAGN